MSICFFPANISNKFISRPLPWIMLLLPQLWIKTVYFMIETLKSTSLRTWNTLNSSSFYVYIFENQLLFLTLNFCFYKVSVWQYLNSINFEFALQKSWRVAWLSCSQTYLLKSFMKRSMTWVDRYHWLENFKHKYQGFLFITWII